MLLPKTTNHFVSAPSFRPWLCWRHTDLYLSLKPGSLYSETYPPRYLLILMLLVTLSRRKPLESIRDLGSWFDVHMRMDVHIGKICTTEDFSWTLQHQKGQKILSAQSQKHWYIGLCIFAPWLITVTHIFLVWPIINLIIYRKFRTPQLTMGWFSRLRNLTTSHRLSLTYTSFLNHSEFSLSFFVLFFSR